MRQADALGAGGGHDGEAARTETPLLSWGKLYTQLAPTSMSAVVPYRKTPTIQWPVTGFVTAARSGGGLDTGSGGLRGTH